MFFFKVMYKNQLFLETTLLYPDLTQPIITLGLKGSALQLLALGLVVDLWFGFSSTVLY